tara:strand:- start:1318 stop:1476 length:159 start_codon:yes stop_codon:yes gene_type:complete
MTKQILALLREAATAGDTEQVAICRRALDGGAVEYAECVRVITEAAEELAGT